MGKIVIRLCSDSGLRDFRSACSIAAAGTYGLTGGFVVTISSKWAPVIDQFLAFNNDWYVGAKQHPHSDFIATKD